MLYFFENFYTILHSYCYLTKAQKPLTEVKRTQMKTRLKPILEHLTEIGKIEKIEFNQLLALLGRTYYWNNHSENYDYELGLQYQQIFNGKNPFEDAKLTGRTFKLGLKLFLHMLN